MAFFQASAARWARAPGRGRGAHGACFAGSGPQARRVPLRRGGLYVPSPPTEEHSPVVGYSKGARATSSGRAGRDCQWKMAVVITHRSEGSCGHDQGAVAWPELRGCGNRTVTRTATVYWCRRASVSNPISGELVRPADYRLDFCYSGRHWRTSLCARAVTRFWNLSGGTRSIHGSWVARKHARSVRNVWGMGRAARCFLTSVGRVGVRCSGRRALGSRRATAGVRTLVSIPLRESVDPLRIN